MSQRRYPQTEQEVSERRDTAVLVGIDRGDIHWPVEESIAELERLANTAEVDVVSVVTQRLERPHSRTFIGSGKVNEVVEIARDTGANIVIFDDEMTPSQQLNLEEIGRASWRGRV